MDLNLTGKRAVVTGGSKGIGAATAALLAEEGAEVIAVSRTGSPPRPGVRGVPLDLTTPASAEALRGAAGPVDILVNNLGGGVPGSFDSSGFLDVDDATWRATYELNLFATVRVTRALLPTLLERQGTIVNVSSIGARAAYPGVDYGTAKAALTNLTKGLAEEFGDRGLRAMTVSPGPTRTANWSDPDGFAGQVAASDGVDLATFLELAPAAMGLTTGRLSEPEETAALIAFLVSPRAANLTGADYLADSGAIKTV